MGAQGMDAKGMGGWACMVRVRDMGAGVRERMGMKRT